MEINGDKVLFSTGTEKDANNGFIGLNQKMCISEGYDGYLYQPREDWMDDKDCYHILSYDEQIELADYMIALWQKFKSQAA